MYFPNIIIEIENLELNQFKRRKKPAACVILGIKLIYLTTTKGPKRTKHKKRGFILRKNLGPEREKKTSPRNQFSLNWWIVRLVCPSFAFTLFYVQFRYCSFGYLLFHSSSQTLEYSFAGGSVIWWKSVLAEFHNAWTHSHNLHTLRRAHSRTHHRTFGALEFSILFYCFPWCLSSCFRLRWFCLMFLGFFFFFCSRNLPRWSNLLDSVSWQMKMFESIVW